MVNSNVIRIASLLLSALVAFFPTGVHAIEPEIAAKLRALFAELQGPGKPAVDRGAIVVDLEGSETIFATESSRLLVPASAMKLVPTIVGLKLLGGSYRFPTEVFVDFLPKELTGPDSGNAFNEPQQKVGNLYVRGYGDPTMSSERMNDLAEAIKQHGVNEVQDLVLDDGLFIDPARPTGPNPYESGLSATSVNNNAYAIYIAPGAIGREAFVSLTAGLGFELVNRVTTSRGRGDNIQVNQVPPSGSTVRTPRSGAEAGRLGDSKVKVTVSGSIGYDVEPLVIYQSVPDPAAYYGTLLAHYLERSGVKVAGIIRRGETPAAAKLLELLESEELSVILQRLNHTSSNFIAGQLLYILGQEDSGYFRYSQGLRRISTVIGEMGIDPTSLTIVEGSGIDRGNRMSAEHLAKMLVSAYKDFTIAPDVISSLSRFGRSGTLRNRPILNEAKLSTLRGEELRATKARALAIWAKTGTLEGVSSLAGFAETQLGRRVAFAIIQNGKQSKEELAAIENRFVSIVAGLPE